MANPWKIAAGTDFLHPATSGPKPPRPDLVNRYLDGVQHAAHVSSEVAAQIYRVQNMTAAPASLLTPGMRQVLGASRHSPARHRPSPVLQPVG